MANAKRITLDHPTSGMAVYMIVVREADGYFLDSAGAFVSSMPASFTALAEDANIRGRYSYDDSRAVWSDGRYSVYTHNAASGTAAVAAPASDARVGIGELFVSEDREVANDIPRVGLRKGVAFPNFLFPMVNASGDPLTGLTVTAQRVLDGGALASCTNTPTEVSGGYYRINLSAADVSADCAALLFGATGAKSCLVSLVTQR